MRFRTRLIVLSIVPMLVSVVLLTSFFLSTRLARLDAELAERAQALARQVAVTAEYGLFSGNRSVLDGVARAVLKDSDVVAVIIQNAEGASVMSLGSPQALADYASKAAAHPRYVIARQQVAQPAVRLDDFFEDVTQPGPRVLGEVGVMLSREGLAAVRTQVISASLLVTGGLVAVACLLAIAYARRIGERMAEIGGAVSRMGAGAQGVRIAAHEDEGELEALAVGFNGMAAQIEESRRGLQEKIELATRELDARRRDAELANQAKSRFLAAASHDLRQPLHALGLFAGQLARRKLPEDEQKLVNRIVESSEALAELLDALLDISRLDAGALEPRRSTFALEPLLHRLKVEFGELAASRGIILKVRPTPYWVRTDASMLERILINLVSNALRYTEQGRILVAARYRGDRLRIEVRDSGVGISPESQGLIFSEFVQLGNPERDRNKGLGLGLSIVQRMCKLLDHPLGVRSRPGVGSVFWLELPRVEPQQSVPAAKAWSASEFEHKRVGVVEDDPRALESLVGQLQSWGLEVFAAGTGAELMVILAAQGVRPELIICDQQLANGELGLRVIDQLRTRYEKDLPALLITGYPSRALQLSAAERQLPILSKPVRPAKLRAALQGLWNQSADAAAEGAEVPADER